jgi:hypothetical protein
MCLVVSSGREIPKIALQAAATKIAAKLVKPSLYKKFSIARAANQHHDHCDSVAAMLKYMTTAHSSLPCTII